MTATEHAGLDRFVSAQAPVWDQALAELAAGSKRGHWMWFVFPQIAGLGQSATARHYAIRSLDEARAYLAHPLLGPRLAEATRALLRHPERRPEDMLGGIDAVKLRSSLTLFLEAGAGEPCPTMLNMWTGASFHGRGLNRQRAMRRLIPS